MPKEVNYGNEKTFLVITVIFGTGGRYTVKLKKITRDLEEILKLSRASNVRFNSNCYNPESSRAYPRGFVMIRFLAVYSPPPGTQKETISYPAQETQSIINTSSLYKVEKTVLIVVQ